MGAEQTCHRPFLPLHPASVPTPERRWSVAFLTKGAIVALIAIHPPGIQSEGGERGVRVPPPALNLADEANAIGPESTIFWSQIVMHYHLFAIAFINIRSSISF